MTIGILQKDGQGEYGGLVQCYCRLLNEEPGKVTFSLYEAFNGFLTSDKPINKVSILNKIEDGIEEKHLLDFEIEQNDKILEITYKSFVIE
jgi:hypothetical protein